MTPEKRQRAEAISNLIRLGWSPPTPNHEQALRIIDDIRQIGDSNWGAYEGHHGRNESLELTDKELVVLSLLAEGHTYDTAAASMNYSRDTIKSYVKTILAKLGAKNTAHAVAIAYRSGHLHLRRAA